MNRHLTNEEAADRLLSDGLVATRSQIIDALTVVDHYRLANYAFPFRDRATGMFRPGTTFDEIWSVYSFDRKLRLTTADALARIEVAVRALIVCHYTAFNPDPFAYTIHANLPKISGKAHQALLTNVSRAAKKAKLTTELPELWVMMEIVPFGSLTYFYEGLPQPVQERVANAFHVAPAVFGGWLTALRKARNICAHNARLWNKRLDSKLTKRIGRATELSGLDAVLQLQAGGDSPTSFTLLSLCAYCLSVIRPQSQWRLRCKRLVTSTTPFVLRGMGFPDGWQDLALWK